VIRPITVIIAAVLLLSPLLVVELSLRALIDAGRLPPAPSSNNFADISITNAIRLGKADILALGTSTIRAALHPDTLEGLVAAEVGRDIHVQNLGQGALSLEGQRLLVQGLAERDRLPPVVIVGMSPNTMTGYQWARAQSWFERSELGRMLSGCADLEEPEAAICRIGQSSALWRWRGKPEKVAQAFEGAFPTTLGDERRRLEESGWVSEEPGDPGELRKGLPESISRTPKEFLTQPGIEAGFVALVDELRSHGVTVVPVAIPYSPLLEDALREQVPGWHEARDAGYARLGEAAGVDVIVGHDWGDWWDISSQNDHRHLSRDGAGPATQQLWEMPEFREPILEALSSTD
jgi:hypothetical protein